MRIEASRAVAAPPGAVYARLTDFAAFEDWARARGLPVTRLSEEPPAWRIGVAFHGLDRDVEVRVVSAAPGGYAAALSARGIEGTATVGIAPAAGGSVLTVTAEARGRGLAGRAALQTLGLARPYLEGRLENALSRLAAEVEGRV